MVVFLSYKIVIMRFIIGIFLLGVAFARRERCGRNARYTKCGTACPLTCDNLDNPPDFCGTMCIQGCQCEEGFVQSRTFGCVEPEDCPKPSSHLRRICLDQPDAGFCGGRRMMWNFNQSTGTCHQFRFGGCGGNGNRYRTEEECLEKCKAPPQTVVIKDGRGQRLKSLAGPYDEGTSLVLVCEAEGGNPAPIVTWWRNGVLIDDTFSQTSQGFSRNELVILKLQRSDFMAELTCQAFNKNLTSINASVKIDLNNENPEVNCNDCPDPGDCETLMTRFYYDSEEERCKEFIYGGCGGNTNNFETMEDCKVTCGEDKKVGPRRGVLPRFFFNILSGQCEKFIYGGCERNSNNFDMKESCEAVCIN